MTKLLLIEKIDSVISSIHQTEQRLQRCGSEQIKMILKRNLIILKNDLKTLRNDYQTLNKHFS